MTYWRTYYHIVWATKERTPLITPEIEKSLYAMLISRAKRERCIVYAVNGMPDHVHMIVAVPPSLAVADVVQKLKGSSSRFVSQNHEGFFKWQAGYGVFTIGPQGLQIAIDYVTRQKEHHANGASIAVLEHMSSDRDGPPLALE